MNELKAIAFNHGRLCELLHAANDEQLANVIEDVKKEQDRRSKELRREYAANIMEAIHKAVKAGLIVNIWSSCAEEGYPDLSIHSNNLFLTNIDVKIEGEDEDEEDE